MFEAGRAAFYMNPKINLRKISFSTYFKTISQYTSNSKGRSLYKIYQTTEFGGEFRNKQRPKLEEIDETEFGGEFRNKQKPKLEEIDEKYSRFK